MLRRALSRPAAPLAALTAFVAGVVAYVLTIAYDTARFTTEDEIWAIRAGRLLERDFPHFITDTVELDRGPERLISLLIAGVNTVVHGVPAQLHVAHVIVVTLYFCAAFPLYALGRRVGLDRWPAAAAAALGIVGPWMIFGATFLNTSLAFPVTVAFAWAAHRAATDPSWRNDALALALAGLNVLARTSHAVFAAALVLAIAYAVWRRRPLGESPVRSVLLVVPRTARAHPLIAAAVAAAVVYVAMHGTAAVAGRAYSTGEPADLGFHGEEIWRHAYHWFAQFTLASAVVPFVIGLAWAVREVARPQGSETGTFAVVWIGLLLCFVYVTGSHNSTIEERYVAPLGGLVAVAFVTAVARRRIWVPGTIVVAALGVWSVLAQEEVGAPEAFDHLTAPSRLVFYLVAVGRAGSVLPIGRDALEVVVMVVAALVAIAVAWQLGRRGGQRTAAVAALPFIVACLVAGVWALEKYKPATYPERSIAGSALIDDIAGDEPVFLWRWTNPENDRMRFYLANLAFTFNESVCCGIWVNDVPQLVAPDGRMPWPHVDWPYLARFAGWHPLGFHTHEVVRTRYFSRNPSGVDDLRVERFIGPPRAAFAFAGTGPNGEVPGGTTAVIQLYPWARRDGLCVSVDVDAAKRQDVVRYTARAGSRSVAARSGRPLVVPATAAKTIELRAPKAADLVLGESALVRCDDAAS